MYVNKSKQKSDSDKFIAIFEIFNCLLILNSKGEHEAAPLAKEELTKCKQEHGVKLIAATKLTREDFRDLADSPQAAERITELVESQFGQGFFDHITVISNSDEYIFDVIQATGLIELQPHNVFVVGNLLGRHAISAHKAQFRSVWWQEQTS